MGTLCQTPPPCCETKTVKDAPAGSENLNGEYRLKESVDNKPHENCADGCVYTKGDDEYCFMNVPIAQAATIDCDATTGGPIGPETSPAGSGAPTGGPEGSTAPGGQGGTTAPGGQGGTTAPGGAGGETTPGGAGTTLNPAERGQAAQDAKDQAAKDKAEAEATQEAAQNSANTADDVGEKIDKVANAASGTTSGATTPANNGRVKRQAATTQGIPTFTVPSSCASFLLMVKEFNTQMGLKTKTGFKTASAIGSALTQVDEAGISCEASDVAELQAVKVEVVAAKAVATTAVIEQQQKIKEAIETINNAIATILEVNIILENIGMTAFADPGTTLATVTAPTLPPVAAETTPVAGAAETTAPAGGAQETTPGAGGPEATTPGGAQETTQGPGGERTTGGAGGVEATTPGGAQETTQGPGGEGTTGMPGE